MRNKLTFAAFFLILFGCQSASTTETADTNAVDEIHNSEIPDQNINLQTENKVQVEKPIVILTTNKGDITVELFPEEAPITVKNFISYVKSGHYDSTIFHRIIDGFMIQGGGFDLKGNQKEVNPPIKLESNNGLKNKTGTLAMARTNAPNSATAQFFINVKDNDFLNYSSGNPGYAVFGQVIDGIEVVNLIRQIPTSNNGPHQNWPDEPVYIEKAVVQ